MFLNNNGVNGWDILGLTANGCAGEWSEFRIFAEPTGDWWIEWGSGSISWYGIGAAKVCLNIDIGAEGSVACNSCCQNASASGRFIAGPVEVCGELEIPWTAAIGAAILVGVPIPGTELIAVGSIGAFAVRATQRLYQTYENLVPIISAKEALEELVRNDTAIATWICGGNN